MKIPQSRCDDALLSALINDELSGKRLEHMLLHIEECDRCRRRMEEMSADSCHWQRTVKALSDSQVTMGPDQSSSAGNRCVAPGTSLMSPEAAIKTFSPELLVKQLLSPPSHPEMLGRIGRYEVERLIGSGGMGVVFKAFDTELNRPVAIKVLAPHLATCGSARQRFAREARAAAAVVHEHVVPIHNVEIEGETPFLVMKYIDGESLQARLDQYGPLEIEEILRIGMQVAAGLASAHQQGLVHRDIKPANILLQQGVDRALITDFGLARAVDDAQLTQSGYHAGTPQYMSPEQVTGQSVDCSSDLFSLGSVFYAMCTGRPPFRAENSYGVIKRIADEQPRSIREINSRIPQWFEIVVWKLLAKQPRLRLQTAWHVSQLLTQCLAHQQDPLGSELPSTIQDWGKEQNRDANSSLEPNVSFRKEKLYFTVVGSLAVGATILLALLHPAALKRLTHTTPDTPSEQGAPPNTHKMSLQPEAVQQTPLSNDLEWMSASELLNALKSEVNEFENKLEDTRMLDFEEAGSILDTQLK